LKLTHPYSKGGQLAARGPHVASQSIFSGPREAFRKSSTLKFVKNCVRLYFYN